MIRKTIFAICLMLISIFAAPLTASAYDPFAGACNQHQANQAAACHSRSTTDPLSGNSGLLAHISNIIAYVAGAIAIIMLIIGAARFITSGGDSGKVTSARKTITNAVIGLVVIVMARVIIYYVVNKL